MALIRKIKVRLVILVRKYDIATLREEKEKWQTIIRCHLFLVCPIYTSKLTIKQNLH